MAKGNGKSNDADGTPSGHGVSAIRGNGFDKGVVESFVERMLDRHDALATLASEHMLKCKDVRGDMKEILDEAKDAGIKKKALKGVVAKILLERKAEAIREELEGDDQDDFDKIEQALGLLKDTPLGAAALSKAPAPNREPAAKPAPEKVEELVP